MDSGTEGKAECVAYRGYAVNHSDGTQAQSLLSVITDDFDASLPLTFAGRSWIVADQFVAFVELEAACSAESKCIDIWDDPEDISALAEYSCNDSTDFSTMHNIQIWTTVVGD